MTLRMLSIALLPCTDRKLQVDCQAQHNVFKHHCGIHETNARRRRPKADYQRTGRNAIHQKHYYLQYIWRSWSCWFILIHFDRSEPSKWCAPWNPSKSTSTTVRLSALSFTSRRRKLRWIASEIHLSITSAYISYTPRIIHLNDLNMFIDGLFHCKL